MQTMYYYDFRGRIYPVSMLNPVFNKVIRHFFLIKEGFEYKNIYKDILKSQYYRISSKYFLEKDIFSELLILEKCEEDLSLIDRYILFNLVLTAGTVNKKKIYKDSGVHIIDFLKEGVSLLNKDISFTKK